MSDADSASDLCCENCRFWVDAGEGDGSGECKRYPPTKEIEGEASLYAYTMSGRDDWCGEFKWRRVED